MIELEISIDILLLLFATGLLAGTVDAIAGGGGLIALPVLMTTGVTPIQALATNKLQGSFGTLSSTLYFYQKGVLELKRAWVMILFTFIGSMCGTLLVQHIQLHILASLIPFLLILIAVYFLLAPGVGSEPNRQRVSETFFAFSVGGLIGFYDGFFGPGTGSFFALGFVALLGYSLLRATAYTKLLNLTSNLSSLLFFILGGHVIWELGLVMALGQLLGARLGAHLVFLRGTKLIKPMIVTVTLLISLKLLFEQFGQG